MRYKPLDLYDKMPFGKYKDTEERLIDIIDKDFSYISWLAKNTELVVTSDVKKYYSGNKEYRDSVKYEKSRELERRLIRLPDEKISIETFKKIYYKGLGRAYAIKKDDFIEEYNNGGTVVIARAAGKNELTINKDIYSEEEFKEMIEYLYYEE